MGVALVGMAACGGNGGGEINVGGANHCGQVFACGGDIVGTWKVVQACVTRTGLMTFPPNLCTPVPGDNQLNVAGTYTFGANMTYSVELTSSDPFRFPVPGCVAGGVCGGPGADAGTGALSCAGTYVKSGVSLTVLPTRGLGMDAFYCVQGDLLHVMPAPSRTSAILEDFVAQRQ